MAPPALAKPSQIGGLVRPVKSLIVAPKSITPVIGHPLEATPESLIIHGTKEDFSSFVNSIEFAKPDALPKPRSFDQLSLFGKVARVATVPSAVVAAVANPSSSPRLSEILGLETTFTWGTALRHRGWSRRDASIVGLGLDMGLDPLWFLEFGPLTKLGTLAKHYTVSKRLGQSFEKSFQFIKGIDDTPDLTRQFLKGFQIEKGSDMAKRVAAAHAAGMDTHYGMNWYDHAKKGQQTLIGFNIPFFPMKGAIPLVPRQVSMLAFGLPRLLRRGFLKGAQKVPVPGDPTRTLSDLALAGFLKDRDPLIKEVQYLFRGILKRREAKVYTEVIEKFNDELARLSSDDIDSLTRVFEDRQHFDLAASGMQAQDFLKAGLPKEVANNPTVQKFMLKMRDDLRRIIDAEKEFGQLKIAELEDPINYILHLVTPDALSKLRGSSLYARLPAEWTSGHGSQIMRQLRELTASQVNDLGQVGKIPGLEGIVFEKFFENNPVMLLYTRMLRGIRSITGAQYARTAGEFLGTKIPRGVPRQLFGEIKVLGESVQKLRARRKKASRNRTIQRDKLLDMERALRQTRGAKEVQRLPRTLVTQRKRAAQADERLTSVTAAVQNAEEALALPAATAQQVGRRRRIAIDNLKGQGGGFQSKSVFLENYRFPNSAIRDQVDSIFGKMSSVESMSDWWRYYDATLTTWKGMTLAPFPAYHFRNWIDNMWRNYLAGMPPIYYLHARRALGHLDNNADSLAAIANRNVFGKPNPRGEMFTFGGLIDEFTAIGTGEMAVRHQDVVARATAGEIRTVKGDIKDALNPLSDRRPITGFLFDKARAAYENPARLAHYMWRRQMGDSALEAKLSVQKFLFDYDELEPWVRKSFGRIFPFTSWMRFNIPFQIEQMFQNSRRLVPLAHVQTSQIIPALLSKDDRELEARFLKDWQREGSPLFLRRDPNNRDKMQYMMLDGWMSTLDLIRLMDPGKYFVGMLSPLLREPLQQVSNMDFVFKRPLTTYAGIADMTLETEDFIGMPIHRRLAHGLRNFRAFNDVDRIIKLMADKDTPREKFTVALQRTMMGGGFQEIGEIQAFENLRFRQQRIALEGRKAYLRAIRRDRWEEGWNLLQTSYARILRGY